MSAEFRSNDEICCWLQTEFEVSGKKTDSVMLEAITILKGVVLSILG